MIKLIAFADLHVHTYREFDDKGSRLEDTLRVLDIVFAYADKQEAKAILFAGDLVEATKSIPTQAINGLMARFKKLFTKYPNIPFIAVSGNHDYATQKLLNQPIVTCLTAFAEVFPNFKLIDDTYIDIEGCRIHGVPYYRYPDDYYSQCLSMSLSNEAKNLLLTHATVTGYDFIAGCVDPKHQSLRRFDLCLSGDIHKHSWLSENFLMLGNPLQKDRSDAGQKKGIWRVELENGVFNPVFINLNSKFPEFITVKEADVDNHKGSKDFITVEPTITTSPESLEEVVAIQKFSTVNTSAQLVTSYWEAEDGVNDERLAVGLSLL